MPDRPLVQKVKFPALPAGGPWQRRVKRWLKAVREVMYGWLFHELDIEMRKEKGHLEDLFGLVVFGDFVGLPILPPYFSLRLLPFMVPTVHKWKRRILRERDLTDFVAGDL
jgi:hypothetical protein